MRLRKIILILIKLPAKSCGVSVGDLQHVQQKQEVGSEVVERLCERGDSGRGRGCGGCSLRLVRRCLGQSRKVNFAPDLDNTTSQYLW